MIYFDTETCGLHGPIVLIQSAIDRGPVRLHSVFENTCLDTLNLLDEIIYHPGGVCGYNLAFDWFHVCQTYTTLMLLPSHEYPIDIIEDYADAEMEARNGPCIKPASALDLMMHARKGPYQSTMDRKGMRIKRVPTILASQVCDELNKRVTFNPVYFARRKEVREQWQLRDVVDEDGKIIYELQDVVLEFAPSTALKALAIDALGYEDVTYFSSVEPPESARPEELGFAPYAKAPVYDKFNNLVYPNSDNWMGKWPDFGKIRVHNTHWSYNSHAREYAADDVIYTRGLHYYFSAIEDGLSRDEARQIAKTLDYDNLLPTGDVDSELTCMVAACRWRGYTVDIEGIKELKTQEQDKVSKATFAYSSPEICRRMLTDKMHESEQVALLVNGKMTTDGKVLEHIAKWKVSDVCPDCNGGGCEQCDDGEIQTDEEHPAADVARTILEFRHADKKIQLYDKLIQAGRFHASFKVIGTLSSRMAGADSLNAQGIDRSKDVRTKFPLKSAGEVLCGGDFESFEVVLMDADYGDPELHRILESGKKLHAIMGTYLFPPMSYEQIMETKGLPGEQDKYGRGKNGVFCLLYGGDNNSLVNRVGVSQREADKAYENFCIDFKVWAHRRQLVFNDFCSMRQPGGIGSKVEWHDPADYVESMFGFKRFFSLENRVCKVLFELAEDPPAHWNVSGKIIRRDREQTFLGAARSSLVAAAFNIQSSNMRAAANHRIQSSGATLTKELQNNLWRLQPCGIHGWYVQPLNIHDEIMCPSKPEIAPKVKEIVDSFVLQYKPRVPLLGISWDSDLESWGEK